MANISSINGLLIDAATASLATTASYALTVAGGGGGSAFPYVGNAVITGSLTVSGSGIGVTGSINATSITSSFTGSLNGALVGTASWATNAVTAITASVIRNQRSSTNAPFYLTAVDSFNSGIVEEFIYGVNIIVNPSNSSITASGGISASLVGTASWATNAIDALTASYVVTAQTASFVTTAQTASFLNVGTYSITSSWAQSASQALTSSRATSASYALSSSFASNADLLDGIHANAFVLNSQTSSMSASYALTASYALNGGSGGGGGASGPLAGIQLVRTSSYTTTNTFTDLIFSEIAEQSDPTVVYRDNTNQDRVYVTEAGLYQIAYHATVGANVANDFVFRVVKNDLDTISGSFANGRASSTDMIGASAQVLTTLAANDYISLQVRYTSSAGNASTMEPSASLFVVKMDGITGAAGPSGSTFPYAGHAVITGSLLVSGSYLGKSGITGSLLGTSSYAITASYALTSAGGGGGGTPGGAVNEVQYNNGAGGFAGAANVEISTAGNLLLVATTDPATPSAGTLEMYSKTIAGRTLPKVKGPSGLDYVLQPALFQNANYLWTTTGATAGVWQNTAGQGNGTFQATNPTTSGGTLYTVQKRSRYSNVVTTANQILGQRNTDAIFFRGGTAGQGGFFFYTRCGFDTWTNGGRFFAGMATATTVVTADPSALNNTVGFCVDVADNGAISFLTRGTTATKQATGLTITTGKGYDIFIFNAPNSATFSYRIVDLITTTEFSGTATLNPPAAGTALTANVLASNAAVTPANSIQLGISKIYIETDY